MSLGTAVSRRVGGVADGSPVRAAVAVFLLLLAAYLPSATYDYRVSTDVAMVALPAWNLVENGTLDLAAYPGLLELEDARALHLVETEDGRVLSNRTVGVVAFGAVAYLVASPLVDADPPFPMWPATVAGVLATAGAMAVLHLVLRRLLPARDALVGALVAGLGTGAWAVAADGLWAHGPSMLWLAVALLGLASGRWVGAGAAFGLGLLVRPYNALAAAVTGTWAAVRERSLRPLVGVGLPSAAGLALLVWANGVVYGSTNVAGGYSDNPSVAAASEVVGRDYGAMVLNFLGAFVDPQRGLVWYSPFLVVLACGLPAAWRVAEAWVKSALVAGGGALLIQYWVQQSQGGSSFFGYRYPLEALVLAAPALALAWREWVSVTPRRRRVFRVTVVLAVSLQVLGAVVEPTTRG